MWYPLVTYVVVLLVSILDVKGLGQYWIPVDNVLDYPSDTSYCYPESTGSCNLRSAFYFCLSISPSSPCTISLPSNSTIYINKVLGQLEATSAAFNVTLLGNGAKIKSIHSNNTSPPVMTRRSSTNRGKRKGEKVDTMNFGYYPYSYDDSNHYSYSDDDEVDPVLSHDCGSLSHTNSATENTCDVLFLVCPNSEYTVQTFQESGGGTWYYATLSTDDTFIRLMDNFGQEIAYSDDEAGGFSSIYFTASPELTDCVNYTVKAGCFEDDQCDVTVEVYTTFLKRPRFLFISDNITSMDSGISPRASLHLVNMSFSDFGDKYGNGAVLYVEGNIALRLEDVKMHYNQALYGGSIFLNYIDHASLHHVKCTHGEANKGGCIYLDKYCSDTDVKHMHVTHCRVEDKGGALALNLYNHHTSVVESFIAYCEAIQTGAGGGIYVQDYNNYVTIDQLRVEESTSVNGGGGVAFGSYNNYATVQNSTFIKCITQSYGGGLYFYSSNAHGKVLNVTFIKTETSTYDGGGLGFNYRNTYMMIQDNVFFGCKAKNNGGAIFVYASNEYLEFNRNTITNCSSAKNGGAIFIDEAENITISNSVISQCYSKYGGGIAFEQGNTMRIVNTIIRDSYAIISGGGIALVKQNTKILIRKCLISRCTAVTGGGFYLQTLATNSSMVDSSIEYSTASLNGGGMYIDNNNNNWIMKAVNINHCTAKQYGGGIYTYINNKNIVLFNSTLAQNTAGIGGGGFATNNTNTNITFAGSNIDGNVGGYNGGGVYVGYSHSKLNMIDTIGYFGTTLGNYTYKTSRYGILFEQYIEVPHALGYVIYFDSLTIGGYEEVYIYAGNNFTLEHSWTVDSQLLVPGKNSPALFIAAKNLSIFVVGTLNSAVIYNKYYSVAYTVYPTIDITYTTPTVLQHNQCQNKGGAVFMYSNNLFSTFLNSKVVQNQAIIGGGIFIQLTHGGTVLNNMQFLSNRATSSGGALTLSAGNYGIEVTASLFQNNSAKMEGGALYIGTNNGLGPFAFGNSIYVQKNVFNSNNAISAGGAVYVDSDNTVVFYDGNRYVDNVVDAGDGGAMFLNALNVISIQSDIFDGNKALSCGGAMHSSSSNALKLQNITIRNNMAYRIGGGLCLKGSTKVTFRDSNTLQQNEAYFGGAIAAFDVDLWSMASNSSLRVVENKASRGSAMYCYPLAGSATQSLRQVSFENNIASAGGTVYWLYDSVMTSEPPGLHNPSVAWVNNVAPYGIQAGTQGIRVTTPNTYTVSVYNQNLNPPLQVSLRDYYGNFMPINNDTAVYVSIVTTQTLENFQVASSPALTLPQCKSIVASLSGENIVGVKLKHGYATFSELQAFCTPRGNFTLAFQADLGDQIAIPVQLSKPYYIHNTTYVAFRGCLAGEYEKNGQCLTCPSGSYNFAPDMESCLDCTKDSGIDECYADQVVVSSGYWRRYPDNTAVLKCLLASESCVGGNVTGNSLCAAGYTGPLCSVCDTGYYLSDDTCQACEGTHAISTTMIVVMVVVTFVILMAGSYYYFIDVTALTNGTPSNNPSVIEQAYVWFKARYTDITVRTKIMVSTFQIITATSTIFAVSMPKGFTGLSNIFRFVNVNFGSIVPLGCSHDFNFMDQLLWSTLTPIFVTMALAIFFAIEYFIMRQQIQANTNRQKGAKREQFEMTKNKYLNYFFYLTYLILPSVTTTIFQFFVCQNIDPNNEDSGGDDYYLVADMSISCQSDYYQQWTVYAVLMIFLYPIGIPCMYLFLLYCSRDDIMNRDQPAAIVCKPSEASSDAKDKEEGVTVNPLMVVKSEEAAKQSSTDIKPVTPVTTATTSKRIMPPTAARLTFLFAAYEPKYWYWEIVETTRRIVLTAMLSVVAPGTSTQNVISMMLAVFYLKLYSSYQPYLKARNDTMAEVGQIQIYFTFFGALVVQNSLLTGAWETIADTFLVLVNFSIVFITLYFQYEVYQERVKANAQSSMLDITPLLALFTTRHSTSKNATNKKEAEVEEVELATFSSSKDIEQGAAAVATELSEEQDKDDENEKEKEEQQQIEKERKE